MIHGVNKKIAVEPFPKTSIEVKVKDGFSTASQKTSLTPLKVLFRAPFPDAPNGRLDPGDVIFVRGDAAAHQFAKEVFVVEETSFILVPADLVVMVDAQPTLNIPGFSYTPHSSVVAVNGQTP